MIITRLRIGRSRRHQFQVVGGCTIVIEATKDRSDATNEVNDTATYYCSRCKQYHDLYVLGINRRTEDVLFNAPCWMALVGLVHSARKRRKGSTWSLLVPTGR